VGATVALWGPPPPPLGVVFAFKSKLKLTILKEDLENFQSGINPRLWINILCIHDKGIIFYGDSQSLIIKTELNPTCKLEILNAKEDTLFKFYVILVGHLSIAEERIPNIRAYAGIPTKGPIQDALDLI